MGAFEMRTRLLPAIMLALITGFSGMAQTATLPGGDQESLRATLRGVASVGVAIAKVPDDVQTGGLTQQRSQTVIELQLRKAGVPIVDVDPTRRGLGIVYVTVDSYELRDGVLAVAMEMQFLQQVRLVRDNSTTVLATTWRGPMYLGIVSKRSTESLTDKLAAMADEFANDFLAENSPEKRSSNPSTRPS
jgi:hypothetical protein